MFTAPSLEWACCFSNFQLFEAYFNWNWHQQSCKQNFIMFEFNQLGLVISFGIGILIWSFGFIAISQRNIYLISFDLKIKLKFKEWLTFSIFIINLFHSLTTMSIEGLKLVLLPQNSTLRNCSQPTKPVVVEETEG